MEVEWSSSFANILLLQQSGSVNRTLSYLVEQFVIYSESEENQEVLLSAISYFTKTMDETGIEADVVTSILHKVCYPHIKHVLVSLLGKQGEYTWDLRTEKVVDICSQCLPLSEDDEAITGLLQSSSALLSDVFLQTDEPLSDAKANGLRILSRLVAIFIPALSDAAMQPLQASLLGLLQQLLCSTSCQSAATLVAPALLSRRGFSITHGEALLTSLLARGEDDLGRRLSAANALQPLLPHDRSGAPAALLLPLLTAGVSAANPPHRREARRLLRNCCGGGTAWEDLLLLLEALEEKQLHLVQPAMTKLESLLANANGVPLHYSLCVLRRAAAHAAAAVRRWAVLRMLQLEPSAEVELLVTEVLLPALNDSSLFSDVEKACWDMWEQKATYVLKYGQFYSNLVHCGDWSVPTECGRRLCGFVTGYLSGDRRMGRASALVSALCQMEGSAVSLCHVTLALATVPSVHCLDGASVRALCRLASDRVTAHEPVLRRSSQLAIFRIALTWFDWEHNSDLECLVALARLCSVKARRYSNLERCDPLYSLLRDCDLAELRIGLASGLDLGEMLCAALQESSGPTRGRELGGVCRLLRVSLPLTPDHPALARLRAGLQRCHSDVYRPPSDVVSEMAALTALAAQPAAEPVAQLVREVAPSVTEWIIRHAEAAEVMADFEMCTFYGQFLCVCTHELSESVVLRLCGLAGKDRPLTLHAVVATVLEWNGDLYTYQSGSDVYNAFFRLVVDAVDDSVTEALASFSGAAALHLEDTWRIVVNLLMFRHADQEWCEIARRAVAILPVCPRRALEPLLSALRPALSSFQSEDAALVAAAISAGWTAIGEHRRSGAFSHALKPFAQLVFYNHTDSPQRNDQARKMAEELMQLSATVPAALLYLTQAVKNNYRANSSRPFRMLAVDVTVSALLYVDVHRRDRRLPSLTADWLLGVGDFSDPDYICREDIFTHGLSMLQLIVQHDHELVAEVVRRLVDSTASAAEGRQFANSAAHRRQLRAWRALLLLAMKDAQDDGLTGVRDELCEATCSALVQRGAQPSVRRLQEWTVMKLCVKLPQLCGRLWHYLDQAGSERTAAAGSFVFVLTHLAELELRGDCGTREEFVYRCYDHILPGCMAQNFSTRASSQAALNRLWSLAEKSGHQRVLSKFGAAHRAAQGAQEMARTSAASAGSSPDDAYFSDFDPRLRLADEDVLIQLPRLMGVEPDEWGRFTSDGFSIQLIHLKTGRWGTRSIPAGPGLDAGGDTGPAPGDTQFQRKTTPRRPAPSEDRNGGDAPAAGLVVAASLVEKSANLGGLCRTCEVLGVGGLVLSSLRKADEHDFQSLSVSAERWLGVSEVPPRQLPEYLRRMKADGYTLVGAEQTSNSQPANQYQFPAKTLLLLGNEKQGIPGDVLQQLDVCLEIPQRGVVRSLNVHVAGALLMWEYCRQHC